LKFVCRRLLSQTCQKFGRKSKNSTVFELPDDNDYSEKRFAGCEHVCACEFSLKKMLELFANSPAAVCFPRLSKNRGETNEHHSVSFLKMTMIMLKSVSRDANMNVFATFQERECWTFLKFACRGHSGATQGPQGFSRFWQVSQN
jgi:hypothetical protein